MAPSPSNPHDAYFRQVLSRPAEVTGELRAVLPKAVATRVDWSTLAPQSCSFFSPQLRSRYSDLLFRARIDGHDAYIYLLIEHQSRPDPLMPMRMLEYLAGIWSRYVREHPDTTVLPAVVPVVIHASPHGRGWNAPTELAELIDIDPATREALGKHLPRFQFLLDDLTSHDIPTLRARALAPATRLMLILLKVAPGNNHLDTALLSLLDDLQALLAAPGGTRDLECLVTYILTVGETNETDLERVLDRLGPQAKEVILTTAERLRAEGEARGEARGRAEGEAQGRASTLLEQLTTKFGPLPTEITDTLHSADTSQLRLWSTRVLTANSLDEVFEPQVDQA
ncbi:Rpn family recombination-promoting nuclease/putative transposase [Nocardia sp. NPDC050406]|uniref:Rpn family recombination-promoting nuclease/putative transposase n=1 Tax=Nocardia sp. NPDC050406 TaxID=3364318 RepID=UPI0037ABDCAA